MINLKNLGFFFWPLLTKDIPDRYETFLKRLKLSSKNEENRATIVTLLRTYYQGIPKIKMKKWQSNLAIFSYSPVCAETKDLTYSKIIWKLFGTKQDNLFPKYHHNHCSGGNIIIMGCFSLSGTGALIRMIMYSSK